MNNLMVFFCVALAQGLGDNKLLIAQDLSNAEQKPVSQDIDDKDLNTKYILGILKDSKTKWWRSDDWKQTIAKDGATVRTIYKAFSPGDKVDAGFTLEHRDTMVLVRTVLMLEDRDAHIDSENEERFTECGDSRFIIGLSICTTTVPQDIFMKHIGEKKAAREKSDN